MRNRKLSVSLRQMELLMNVRLKGTAARSCGLCIVARDQAREERVLLFSIQLVL